VAEFPVSAQATSITTGPDGNIWFTESDNHIGQITPTGAITELSVPVGVLGISAGPDGNLWMVGTGVDSSGAFPRNVVARTPGTLPPSNTTPPTIIGAPAVDQPLTCSRGSWTNKPTSFTYQWNQDGEPIAGATGDTYVVQSADQGHAVTCTVTASNAAGSSSPATSAGVSVPVTNPTGGGSVPPTGAPPPSGGGSAPPTGTSPPASAPAARCTLASTRKVTILHPRTHRKPRSTASGRAGTLTIRVRCNQTATLKLAAQLADTQSAKHHGHTPRAKRYHLRTVNATTGAGTVTTLKLTLPAAAIHDLIHRAQESVSIILTASNGNGNRRTTAHILQLRT